MTEAAIFVVILVAVGAGAFYAGWRSARAYLSAAEAVCNVTNAVATQSNQFSSELERSAAAMTAVRTTLDRNTEVLDATRRDLEAALLELFNGFERAGLVRKGTARPRQVGEPAEE